MYTNKEIIKIEVEINKIENWKTIKGRKETKFILFQSCFFGNINKIKPLARLTIKREKMQTTRFINVSRYISATIKEIKMVKRLYYKQLCHHIRQIVWNRNIPKWLKKKQKILKSTITSKDIESVIKNFPIKKSSALTQRAQTASINRNSANRPRNLSLLTWKGMYSSSH